MCIYINNYVFRNKEKNIKIILTLNYYWILNTFFLCIILYNLTSNSFFYNQGKHRIDIFYNKKDHAVESNNNDMLFLIENVHILIYDDNNMFKGLLVYIKNNRIANLLNNYCILTLLFFIYCMNNITINIINLFKHMIRYDFSYISIK